VDEEAPEQKKYTRQLSSNTTTASPSLASNKTLLILVQEQFDRVKNKQKSYPLHLAPGLRGAKGIISTRRIGRTAVPKVRNVKCHLASLDLLTGVFSRA
jgi:hypothetical protein